MAGLAITAFTLPAVPFSAIAGVVVDRVNRTSCAFGDQYVASGDDVADVLSPCSMIVPV